MKVIGLLQSDVSRAVVMYLSCTKSCLPSSKERISLDLSLPIPRQSMDDVVVGSGILTGVLVMPAYND